MKSKRINSDNDGATILVFIVGFIVVFAILMLVFKAMELYERYIQPYDTEIFVAVILISAGAWAVGSFTGDGGEDVVYENVIFELELSSSGNASYSVTVPIPCYETYGYQSEELLPFNYTSSYFVSGQCNAEIVDTEYGKGLKITSSSDKLVFKNAIEIKQGDYGSTQLSMEAAVRSDTKYNSWVLYDGPEGTKLKLNYHRSSAEYGHQIKTSAYYENDRKYNYNVPLEDGWNYVEIVVR
jgi:hypothetical protein